MQLSSSAKKGREISGALRPAIRVQNWGGGALKGEGRERRGLERGFSQRGFLK